MQTEINNSVDPIDKLPGSCSVEIDATQIGESAKALRVRFSDGRETWVPKSVGLIATRHKEHGVIPNAWTRSASEFKTVLIVPVWFLRKMKKAA